MSSEGSLPCSQDPMLLQINPVHGFMIVVMFLMSHPFHVFSVPYLFHPP